MRKNILSMLLATLLCGGALAAQMLVIKDRITAPDQSAAGRGGFYSARAKEQLLSLDREAPFGLPKAAIAAGVVDTISIIAFRIDFRYENPDDPLTTGRGTFDLRSKADFITQEGHGLDPAPHNRDYIEAHMRALTQYWKAASHGKLQLLYEVWPRENDSAYHLDTTMGYYGEQPPNFGLGEFFHDALRSAYAADSVVLDFHDARGRKKAVMLFHAGADRQTDLSFSATPTPSDLYTGFATFDSDNWVILGADTVVEGVIMPETMTQDNRITVLNAVMAHEFGHQLGLVDLYNTGSSPFLTQVGDFALMDNNGMNTAAFFDVYGTGVFGTVPIFPSAWSRAFLGFDEVTEYRSGTSLELAAVKMQGDGVRIAKVPLSATEYYLLENRRGDVDGQVDGLRQDSVTDVILWPVKIDQAGDSLKAVPEYDLYLPGNAAGIAIWHIDEGVAAMDYFPFDYFPNNFEANTLQWDPARRFLTLVEADGVIEFGGNYARGYGSPQKLFYAGNNTHFGSYTNPPTRTNDGGYSHVDISQISPPGMVMTFDLAQDMAAANFPRRLSLPSNTELSPVAYDLDSDGSDEILAVAGRRILAVRADGRDFLDTLALRNDIDTIFSTIHAATDVNADLPRQFDTASMPVFAEISEATSGVITTGPVVGRFGDTTVVYVGTSKGGVYAYLPVAVDIGPDMFHARLLWSIPPQSAGAVKAIITDETKDLIYIFLGDEIMLVCNWSNTQRNGFPFDSLLFVGACRYDSGLAIVREESGRTVLYQTRDVSITTDRDSLLIDSISIDETGFFPPVANNLDRYGSDEVVLLSRSGHLLVYSFLPSGIIKNDALDIQTGDTAAAGPTLGDFSGTGFADILVPGTNRIYGYDRNGLTALDFPLTVDNGRTGQLVISSPIVSDITGDGRPELAMVTLDSMVRAKTTQIYYLDSLSSPDTIYIRAKDTVYHYYNYFSNLYVISPDAWRVEGFPVPAGAHGVRATGEIFMGAATPLHLKKNGEGMLVEAGGDGWMTAWRCGWSDDAAYWPMANQSAGASRRLPGEALGPQQPLADFLPEKRFFGYPNPATGEAVTIHYYINAPARITITIFDALGDRITEMSREVPEGNREDEVIWNLGGVASGVYHCRIEAEALSGGMKTVAIKPIAVVK